MNIISRNDVTRRMQISNNPSLRSTPYSTIRSVKKKEKNKNPFLEKQLFRRKFRVSTEAMTVQSREGSGCQYTGITENWFSSQPPQTNRRGRASPSGSRGVGSSKPRSITSCRRWGKRREDFFSLENERDKGKNRRERGGDEKRKGSVERFSPKYRRVSGKFIRRGAARLSKTFRRFSRVSLLTECTCLVYLSSHRSRGKK